MSNQLKIGTFLSYIQMALNVIIKLVYTPFLIRLLGQSEYGLYQTTSSIIIMMSILSLGFSHGYIRHYSIYNKQNKKESIYKLNGLFLIVFSIIGLAALACGLFLANNLQMVFDSGLDMAEYDKAKILMIIMTISLAISFPMSVFQSIITAHERFVVLKLLAIIKTVFSPLVVLPLLLMGFRSIAMVLSTVLISFIIDSIHLVYVIVFLDEKIIIHDFEKGLFKSIFAYTIFIAVNTVIDQINWNIDKILLGRYKGTNEVAVYAVGFTLYQCYMMCSVSISGVFTPRIHRIINDTRPDSKEQRSVLTDLFIKVGRVQFAMLGLIASGIFFFGKYFITSIWASPSYYNAYYVALLLIIPASIALTQNIGIEIQRAENRHQFRSICYSIMAIINLILSIILCQRYGAIGSAIGTAISLILANGIIMNFYYNSRCNIDVKSFWKSIMKLSRGMIVPIVVGIIVDHYFIISSLFVFIAAVIGYSFIYSASMWLLGLNQFEKELVLRPVNRLLWRKNAC